jgi:hypothetical protein
MPRRGETPREGEGLRILLIYNLSAFVCKFKGNNILLFLKSLPNSIIFPE